MVLHCMRPVLTCGSLQEERVDETMDVSQQEAEGTMRALARVEGIFAGPSSGGAVSAALRLSARVQNATIVAIICDRGDRYLSTGKPHLDQGILLITKVLHWQLESLLRQQCYTLLCLCITSAERQSPTEASCASCQATGDLDTDDAAGAPLLAYCLLLSSKANSKD